jgi:hypothetical protein
MEKRSWQNASPVQTQSYTCSFCGNLVASALGFAGILVHNGLAGTGGWIRICPHCDSPTYFDPKSRQVPSAPPGGPVASVPKDVGDLYEEARRSAAANAPTAAVLVCRKILMHIGVEKGADPGKTFIQYIDHLQAQGYIHPDARGWVDYIRMRSNDANHDVTEFTAQDAAALIELTQMLLRLIYEFPKKVPPKS